MKSASDLYNDIKSRIKDIDSIITKGNSAFQDLEAQRVCLKGRTIMFRGQEHDHKTLYNELLSYGKEKNILQEVLTFYNTVDIGE